MYSLTALYGKRVSPRIIRLWEHTHRPGMLLLLPLFSPMVQSSLSPSASFWKDRREKKGRRKESESIFMLGRLGGGGRPPIRLLNLSSFSLFPLFSYSLGI